MDLISLHSPPLTALHSSRKALVEKSSFLSGLTLAVPKNKRCPYARNLKFLDFRARTSGSIHGTSGSNLERIKSIKQEMPSKDEDLAFVAGATGRVGSRTVRELLKLGFRVRACVRNAQKAQSLVQSVQQLKRDDGAANAFGIQSVEKLEIVECDLERDAIGLAIGKSSIVICCIGASEKEAFDVTGPYRIDYQATKKLIDAATVAKVSHFILLTSLGTNKIGFPAAILNLFWGVLIWKRKAEEALISSGLPYTIMRPGGMERPTDAYKETHNLVLANEDTYFGGQVSNLQVAELMAFMAKNRSLSYCKIVEVIAETTSPPTPMGKLLFKIPSQNMGTSSLKVDGKPVLSPTQSVVSEATRIQTKVQKTGPLSPYIVYDDLKPPTSPSPSAPTISFISTSPMKIDSWKPSTDGSSMYQAPSTSKPIDKQHLNQEKTWPLSPFTMYEDLKPPSSPMPSSPMQH